jgi:hypothetical protein
MNRRILFTVAASFAIATQVDAQEQSFPDGGFENCWKEFTTQNNEKYWDFQDEKNGKEAYFLSTLNLLHDLEVEQGIAPLTAFRLTGSDVRNGKYSLKLVSNYMTVGEKSIFLPGAAGTLKIIIDMNSEVGGDCIVGRPFTFRPSALKGWKKCLPESGDTAAIEIKLKKNGVVIGNGIERMSSRDADWKEFNVPVNYTSDDAPDTIIVIFSASGAYDFTNIETLMDCKGKRNSTLLLDDIELEYLNGIKEMLAPEMKLNIYPNPSTELVNIQMANPMQGTVIIYDYLTRKVGEYPICGTQIKVDIRDYAVGSYLINVLENNRVVSTGRFMKE